jgi:hypothetical protein
MYRSVAIVLFLLWATAVPGVAHTQEVALSDDDDDTLVEAILSFERGELGVAADGFNEVLGFPVKIRGRKRLHQGFLHWAYTLFLQDSQKQAEEKLDLTLRLNPEYEPSPVVLRPDLYAFYQDGRARFLTANGGNLPREREGLDSIFPELQVRAGAMGPNGFIVPIAGIGLERLGHVEEGRLLRVVEVTALAVNLTSLGIRLAVFSELTPAGDLWHDISVTMNAASFFVFWPVFIADIVATLSLQAKYTKHPELRPRLTGGAGRNRAPAPVLGLGSKGLTLTFW